jgi:hypothetical protein
MVSSRPPGGQVGTARSFLDGLTFARHGLQAGLWPAAFTRLLEAGERPAEGTLSWDVAVPEVADSDALGAWCRHAGLRIEEGSRALYLPPQDALAAVSGELVGAYPGASGLKILRDLNPPHKAHYLGRSGTANTVRRILAGDPRQQMVAANYMWTAGIGPRVWDVCVLKGRGGQELTAFVVEHVDGRPPTTEEWREFIGRLEGVIRSTLLRVLVPDWKQAGDFAAPDCNRNLLVTERQPSYVDFQNFGLGGSWTNELLRDVRDVLHFGASRWWRPRRYLYQSIPGRASTAKRDTETRWAWVDGALRALDIGFEGRIVMDVGCNAGMMLGRALRAGAWWGFGWDRPPLATAAERLLLSLGLGRFTMTGADLGEDCDLQADIPEPFKKGLEEAIVFYLSVREHLGFLGALRTLPWRALVYEGHQGESIDDMSRQIASFFGTTVTRHQSVLLRDGDCGSRPACVLVRR